MKAVKISEATSPEISGLALASPFCLSTKDSDSIPASPRASHFSFFRKEDFLEEIFYQQAALVFSVIIFLLYFTAVLNYLILFYYNIT